MTNETPAAPAGWYPAPHAGNQLRYWDGKGWLDIAPPEPQGQPVPAPVAAVTPAQPRIPEARPVDLGASVPAKPKRRRWPFVVVPFAIVVLIVLVVNLNQSSNSPASSGPGYTRAPESPAAAPEPEPAVPAGYQDTGVGLGIKWVDRDCSITMARCSHLEVIAVDGCPNSVYIELNILDSSGNVVGFTNDTVASLRAGQTAIMEFASFEDDGARVEVVDVSCF